MTETNYGSGGYGRTPADIPVAPQLSPAGRWVAVTLGADDNPGGTEYAIRNVTEACWLDADGAAESEAVWRTRAEWSGVSATGLTPESGYSFAVKARNADGQETESGPAAATTTWSEATDTLGCALTVEKRTSTVTAPAFLGSYDTGITLGGKPLEELGFVVDSISGLDMPRVLPDEELVPGDHTWRIRDEYFVPRRIVLEGHVHGSDPDDLRLRLAYLKSFLATFAGNPWRSTAPVVLTRSDLPDRHWLVSYESVDEMTTLGRRDLAASARVRVTLKSPSPFVLADTVIRATFVPAAGSFAALTLGNAPADAVYVVTGPATDPAFTVGDMVFLADFSDGLAYTDVENADGTGTYTPSASEGAAYRTTETGMGLYVAGTDTVNFAAPGNTGDGAWVVVAVPQWISTAKTGDVTVFEHRGDADNYLRLFWDGSAQAWVFRKSAAGTDHDITSAAQTFTAGTPVVLGATYDRTNAGGMRLFVDGLEAAQDTDVTALSTTPAMVYLHAGDGTMQPEAVIDLVAGWSRMLSTDEMATIATLPGSVRNDNAAISYDGTLDTSDLLILDSERREAWLVDVSGSTRTGVLNDVTGAVPVLTPGRRRTASDATLTMVYSRTAAAGMEVRYRRRYL